MTMNPEIAKYWNEALNYYNDAKVAFKKGESDSVVKEKLWGSITYGHLMTRLLNPTGEESVISAGTALDSLSQLECLGIRQAFNKVLQALKEYRNLVPDEYNLPLPTGLDK
jgi:ABC-type microcin C transport system duplicated ATPase subunit YejF